MAHPSGGFTVAADDGFDLWFDVWGEGPGIIFLARSPDENRAYAQALSDAYRVVIFEPRELTLYAKAGLDKIPDEAARATAQAHLDGRNLDWDPSGYSEYPLDLTIGDLHRVADAARLDDFILGGYSGSARLAAFYAPNSDRAVGLIIGGWHILGSMEYWMGFLAGRDGVMAGLPDTPELTKQLAKLGGMQIMLEHNIDGQAAFGTLGYERSIHQATAEGAQQAIAGSVMVQGHTGLDGQRAPHRQPGSQQGNGNNQQRG